jgi:hypothetical protein
MPAFGFTYEAQMPNRSQWSKPLLKTLFQVPTDEKVLYVSEFPFDFRSTSRASAGVLQAQPRAFAAAFLNPWFDWDVSESLS